MLRAYRCVWMILAWSGLTSCIAAPALGQNAGVKVFQSMKCAVVGLENIEGSGTGMILSEDGFILTNAHVVASPLPFKCKVEVPLKPPRNGKDFETVEFKHVKIIGFHPVKDMALVKIDPKEQNVKLQACRLAKRKAVVGEDVYAIGNPGDGGQILEKTMTRGVIGQTDRVLESEKDGVAYYQHDAAINPGNSGGPLCNSDGDVVGMNTLSSANKQGIFFALPLYELNLEEFRPLSERKGNKEEAKQLVDIATRAYSDSRTKRGEEAQYYRGMAAKFYHEALVRDSSNPDLYFNVGVLLNSFESYEPATAYLLQAVVLKPWGWPKGAAYHELGYSLTKQKKNKDALIVWEEGIAKHPMIGASMYDDLAIHYSTIDFEPYKSALAAATVEHLAVAGSRIDTMRNLHRQMADKLSAADKTKLDGEIGKLDATLRAAQTKADQQQKDKHSFLTKAFTDFIHENAQLPDDPAKGGKIVLPKLPAGGTSREPATLANARLSNDTSAASSAATAAGEIDLKVPEGAKNMLLTLDPAQASVKQNWKSKGTALVSPSFPNALIQFPLKPPAEYTLTMIVERETGASELIVGLVRNDKQTMFSVDYKGTVSGLDVETINAYQQPVLSVKKPVTLVFQVIKAGLRVTADGKEIFRQVTSDDFPKVPNDWAVPDPAKLFMGSNGSRFVIHKLMIAPIEAKR